jgi:hypothetical protein
VSTCFKTLPNVTSNWDHGIIKASGLGYNTIKQVPSNNPQGTTFIRKGLLQGHGYVK